MIDTPNDMPPDLKSIMVGRKYNKENFILSSNDQTFYVYLRSDMSLFGLIMTYNRPLHQATYEVILLHTTT